MDQSQSALADLGRSLANPVNLSLIWPVMASLGQNLRAILAHHRLILANLGCFFIMISHASGIELQNKVLKLILPLIMKKFRSRNLLKDSFYIYDATPA